MDLVHEIIVAFVHDLLRFAAEAAFRAHFGNAFPNMGAPLFDCSRVASS
jgi:hypothetical protein